MSALPENNHEVALMANGALMALLGSLDQGEAALSEQRLALHEDIDRQKIEIGETAKLAALQDEQRALSDRRIQLHQRITELRIERDQRVAGFRATLRALD